MRQQYLLGIDNGGSATKCVLFDVHGRVISSAAVRISVHQRGGGIVERDSEDIFRQNCRVIREAMDKAQVDPADIICIGLCGYGGGLGMLDAAGDPVAPFIVSTDSRAQAILSGLQASGAVDAAYAHTYYEPWAGQPTALLSWFRQYNLSLLRRCAHVVMIKDYIRYRLTGVIGTEFTDASNTGLFNIHSKRFDPEVFRIFGIKEQFPCFPERVFAPADIAGHVCAQAAAQTGLREGTPVAAGLYDAAACCLASGILNADTLCLIMGTWSISGRLSAELPVHAQKGTAMFSFLDGWYFLEEASPTAASNLDWFIEQFYRKRLPPGGDIYESCNQRVERIDPGTSDLIFLPYLYGSNRIPGANGCFFNLASHHTSDDVLFAVYEGIMFSLLHHVVRLCGNTPAGQARLSGGASRAGVWCQMLADMMDAPVELPECAELGALGSALCAGIASGAYRDYAQAVTGMCRVRRVYTPNSARVDIYHQKYERFCKAIQALEAFTKK